MRVRPQPGPGDQRRRERQFRCQVRGVPYARSHRCGAFASNGMPSFPDPTFPASGGELFPAIAGFNPASPAFKHAAAACGLQGSIGQPQGG